MVSENTLAGRRRALANDGSIYVGSQQDVDGVRGAEFRVGELQVLQMGPRAHTAAASSGEQCQFRQHQRVDEGGRFTAARLQGFAAWFRPMIDWKRSLNEGQSSYFPAKVGGWIFGSAVRGAEVVVAIEVELAACS
ncbi:uncharacterized protein LOC114932811 [Nylanderia fulva]|uniref:uncharacterized protein LOC114932811 n=1 Tax=Nylanderia fulva TaxID=613905 RepID=UPI0010FBA908|nr:uncharacterized protein LOC114932811 [Nylanderia fulva]